MNLYIVSNPEQKVIEEFMGGKADLGNFSYYFLALARNGEIDKTGVGVKIAKKAEQEEVVQKIGTGVNKLLSKEIGGKSKIGRIMQAVMG